MLSDFGIAIRKVRLERQLLLKDMADTLGVSSAFLSSVEMGQRKVPKGWVDKLAQKYTLSAKEKEALSLASERSIAELKIPLSNTTDSQKNLAFSFAKALEGLTDEDVERIMNAMNARQGRGGNKRATKSRS